MVPIECPQGVYGFQSGSKPPMKENLNLNLVIVPIALQMGPQNKIPESGTSLQMALKCYMDLGTLRFRLAKGPKGPKGPKAFECRSGPIDLLFGWWVLNVEGDSWFSWWLNYLEKPI